MLLLSKKEIKVRIIFADFYFVIYSRSPLKARAQQLTVKQNLFPFCDNSHKFTNKYNILFKNIYGAEIIVVLMHLAT